MPSDEDDPDHPSEALIFSGGGDGLDASLPAAPQEKKELDQRPLDDEDAAADVAAAADALGVEDVRDAADADAETLHQVLGRQHGHTSAKHRSQRARVDHEDGRS